MAEVYTNSFTLTLASSYTAGSGTLSVSAAAPASIQTGTFRVRLGNANNTLLIVTNAGLGTTWSVSAEANDGNAASGTAVYGCEATAGFITAILQQAGSITVGTRASLPGAVPSAGSAYICTDSPFTEYVSDGTNWNGRCSGVAVTDPQLDTSLVQLQTATFTPTITTNQGGVIVTGTAPGDNCFAYAKPVTPSSTLKVSLGLSSWGQGGVAIWNNNTGHVVFLRLVGGGAGGNYNATLYYSRYQTGGLNSNSTTSSSFYNPWPQHGNWTFRFDGTNWYFEIYKDVNCTVKAASVFSEALSTWIGTNYTHIGFAINPGSLVWGQHLRVISA